MTFLNASLLAGLGLIALPIVLHLIMRRQPKHFDFPALRFVQRRQVANTQRLQIQHWLLLALRCAALALAAIALARPNVATVALGSWLVSGALALAGVFVAILWLVALGRNLSRMLLICLITLSLLLFGGSGVFAISALRGGGVLMGDEEAPVAAAIILDTAPHMQYRHENRTRLEVAQETAAWLIQQFPADSQVAMIDTSASHVAFAIDLPAAAKAAERMRISALPNSLPSMLERAQTLLTQSDKTRKEIYVLSDLSTAAWQEEQAEKWRERWSQHPEVALYVIDLGVEQPKNISLSELKLSTESLSSGSELLVETSLSTQGLSGLRTVDLLLDEVDPSLPMLKDGKLILPPTVNRGSEGVELNPHQPVFARFSLRGLSPGVHHGAVRVAGEDGLTLDDTRYFSVEVEEPRPLLLVGGPNVNTRDFAEAISPEALRDRKESRFDCDVAAQNDLATLNLDKYQAVALLDPAPLSADVWNRLANFAREGRGIAIFLGPNAQPIDSFHEAAAREVIGGRIGGPLKAPVRARDVYLSPGSLNHPVFAMYRSMATSVPWDRFPVHYYWPLDQLGNDTRAVASYSDGRTAIAESVLGRGRILLFTTPACEPFSPSGRTAWNELWAGEDAWPWFVLLNESFRYLARLGEGRLNYLTGETVVLQNDLERHPQQYKVFLPNAELQEVSARDDALTIRFNLTPGTYRLRGNRNGPIARGFSSNLPVSATTLTRIDPLALETLLGQGKFQLAKSKEEIHRVVGQQRVGQEMYPYLIMLLVFALALEQLLANRFYQGEGSTSPTRWNWWRSRSAAGGG